MRARSPRVRTPSAVSFASSTGPMPGMRPTGSGASSSASRPGSTIRMPAGLASSEAILATQRPDATPTEADSPSRSAIRARTALAMASGGPNSRSHPVTSR